MSRFAHPALWWLSKALARGALRRLIPQLKTPLGAIAILFTTMGMFFLAMPGFFAMMQPESVRSTTTISAYVHDFIPLALLVAMSYSVLGNAGRLLLGLHPAELHLVLAGPFTSRQLLTYRLHTIAISILPLSCFAPCFLMQHSRSILGACALAPLLSFVLALVSIAKATWECRYPTISYWIRGVWLLAMTWFLIKLASWLYQEVPTGDWQHWQDALELDHVCSLILAIVTPFQDLLICSDWSSLLRACFISFSMVVGMLILAYVANGDFAELAASGADRRQLMLQRLRQGNVVQNAKKYARLKVPNFPYLAGVGPIAWLQATMAVRKIGNIMGFVLVLSIAASLSFPWWKQYVALERSFAEHLSLPAAIAVSYFNGLLLLILQPGTNMPLPQVGLLKLLAVRSWKIILGLHLGALIPIIFLRILFYLPIWELSQESWPTRWVILLAGICLDSAMIGSVHLISANTQLRLVPQGTPDMLQGGRASMYMLLLVFSMLPIAIVAGIGMGLAAFLVGPQTIPMGIGFSLGLLAFLPFQIYLTARGFERLEWK